MEAESSYCKGDKELEDTRYVVLFSSSMIGYFSDRSSISHKQCHKTPAKLIKIPTAETQTLWFYTDLIVLHSYSVFKVQVWYFSKVVEAKCNWTICRLFHIQDHSRIETVLYEKIEWNASFNIRTCFSQAYCKIGLFFGAETWLYITEWSLMMNRRSLNCSFS